MEQIAQNRSKISRFLHFSSSIFGRSAAFKLLESTRYALGVTFIKLGRYVGNGIIARKKKLSETTDPLC